MFPYTVSAFTDATLNELFHSARERSQADRLSLKVKVSRAEYSGGVCVFGIALWYCSEHSYQFTVRAQRTQAEL